MAFFSEFQVTLVKPLTSLTKRLSVNLAKYELNIQKMFYVDLKI